MYAERWKIKKMSQAHLRINRKLLQSLIRSFNKRHGQCIQILIEYCVSFTPPPQLINKTNNQVNK